jgi:FkbM family methyltransferase
LSTETGGLCLEHRKVASSSAASEATRRFGCQRGGCYRISLRWCTNQTENHAHRSEDLGMSVHTTEGEISPRRRTFLDKLLTGHNWRGLAGLLRTAKAPLMVICRYYLKRGSYPYKIGLRTPIGAIDLELYSREDLVTIYEVFFRKDYRVPSDARLVVDFGSNIGISAAYFLTRNTRLKVHAYEPVPANISRAKRNLAPFADRVELVECAVGTKDGCVSFGVESSGRYGGIALPGEVDVKRRALEAYIEVPCRRGEDELRRILQDNPRIDALKIDVEGMEIPLLRSLSIAVLERISCIMAECDGYVGTLPNFTYRQELSIAWFTAAH